MFAAEEFINQSLLWLGNSPFHLSEDELKTTDRSISLTYTAPNQSEDQDNEKVTLSLFREQIWVKNIKGSMKCKIYWKLFFHSIVTLV